MTKINISLVIKYLTHAIHVKFQNKRFRDLDFYIILFSTEENLLEDLENHFETEPEKVLEAIKYQEFDLVRIMIIIMNCAIIYMFDSYLDLANAINDYSRLKNQCCVCRKLSIFYTRNF